MECLGYTYLDNPEELIQARAKIASRSSAARSITTTSGFDTQYQGIASFPVGENTSDSISRSPYIVRSHSVPSGLPSSSSTGYEADFGDASYGVDSVRSNVPNFSPIPQYANPGSLDDAHSRESGWWGNSRSTGTFRGGVPHEGFASQPQSATQVQVGSHHATGSTGQTFFVDARELTRQYSPYGSSSMRDAPESRVSSPSLSDDPPYDYDSESTDTDRAHITELVYGAPSSRDRENNALSYVLQCYTGWLMETAFDPVRTAQSVRSHVVEQFMASEESRSTLISIANVVRSIGKSSTLAPNQVSELRTLHSRVQQAIVMFNANEQHIYEQGTAIALETLGYALEVWFAALRPFRSKNSNSPPLT
ncbi:hypothetical protein FRC07_014749 [Ceratobasidium sp. 392]|nr:hypothetical protein FRC07_014749 [Ceratobasidium sp. 392]